MIFKKFIDKLTFAILSNKNYKKNHDIILNRITQVSDRIEVLAHEINSDRPIRDKREVAPILKYVKTSHKERYEVIRDSYIEDNYHILDIACGIGYGSFIMSENNTINIDAVDIDEKAIKYAKKYYNKDNITFQVGSILNFDKNKKYDIIVSFEIIEHVIKALNTLRKLIKDDGQVIISVPNETTNPYSKKKLYHTKCYTFDEINNLATKNNLKLVEYHSQYTNTPRFVLKPI